MSDIDRANALATTALALIQCSRHVPHEQAPVLRGRAARLAIRAADLIDPPSDAPAPPQNVGVCPNCDHPWLHHRLPGSKSEACAHGGCECKRYRPSSRDN